MFVTSEIIWQQGQLGQKNISNYYVKLKNGLF